MTVPVVARKKVSHWLKEPLYDRVEQYARREDRTVSNAVERLLAIALTLEESRENER
jgi:hypothetical protein